MKKKKLPKFKQKNKLKIKIVKFLGLALLILVIVGIPVLFGIKLLNILGLYSFIAGIYGVLWLIVYLIDFGEEPSGGPLG
jgi:apolipoprotein N-acyltransferase